MPKLIVGYCDPLSAAPGDTVRFMVSSLAAEAFDAQLVRIVCGDISPDGAGFQEIEVAHPINGRYQGEAQPIVSGSYAVVEPHPFLRSLDSVAVGVSAWPTRPSTGRRQTLLSSWDQGSGFAIALDGDGHAVAEFGGGHGQRPSALRTERALAARRWTQLDVTYDAASRRGVLVATPHPLSPAERLTMSPSEASGEFEASVSSGGPLLFAAEDIGNTTPGNHFNGRLDGCRLGLAVGLPHEAQWDFASDIGTDKISDSGGHALHGSTRQLPTRAVPGVSWNGQVHDWRQDRSHYGAIHFHEDDLADAGWTPSCELVVTEALASGVYALRVRTASSEDYMPFFVLPAEDATPAPVAYLAPTVTYRAYANIRLTATTDHIFGNDSPAEMPNERFLREHPECGPGTYAHHHDGSGVIFSSHLRPVLNLKPKCGLWGFTADTNVTAWLEQAGVTFDVLTDDALHSRGLDLLGRYRVIVTGTHPEYWTTPMLDALESYLAGGGRLLYLGGNGFYWRAAFHPAYPASVEVRRAEDGTRYWISEPGEYVHEATGELGGLWRRLGRPPNLLTGIGFAAQGFGDSGYYRQNPGWDDPRVSFAVEGIEGPGSFGDHGTVGGGAAGQEIDRYDAKLGSPSHAIVMASSDGLGEDMLRTKEEFVATGVPDRGSEVRSDVVFFEGPEGGAVFSAGSIAWAASLATNEYDNAVARLTTNVLRRFVDPEPFPIEELGE